MVNEFKVTLAWCKRLYPSQVPKSLRDKMRYETFDSIPKHHTKIHYIGYLKNRLHLGNKAAPGVIFKLLYCFNYQKFKN